eukprot:CAMPEP_0117607888 /NCGR_PEP_ID=MMETSP0784-20121206/80517_1 /TAXON_ID=39447 /ORGANISM="" /LENGTH=68 /DNA_ID=CAMNT_0005411129 /DNA_START=213 /DNA_END=419 /DNA_ORIENTATION=+
MALEDKRDDCLIAGSEQLLRHVLHLGGLPNDTAMNYGLIALPDCSCMVQDYNLDFELPSGSRLDCCIN